MSWNPHQYLKFDQARTRPALDLLNRIAADQPRTVYDLGCGTGNITTILRQRWPDARLVGVDNSKEMLAQAALRSERIEWQLQSLSSWHASEPADVLFSNAALHWLPDHGSLFRQLIESVTQGGTLAVQMPRNFSAPSHTAIRDTVCDGPWRQKLEPLLVSPPVAEPQYYYELLDAHAASLDIWETEYLHVLEGQDPVKEWTKGTWLKRFLDALAEPQRSEFEASYAERVRVAYPRLSSGHTLFPFRRLFIVMRKK
jgi:trans-aconitate 2-methyltransferase